MRGTPEVERLMTRAEERGGMAWRPLLPDTGPEYVGNLGVLSLHLSRSLPNPSHPSLFVPSK